MLTRRLIVCLDVRDGRVVKGVQFVGLRDVGDPVALALRYEAEGADEICFLDISASAEGRGTLLDVVRRTAEQLFIPLTVGGGVRTVDDVAQVLRAGADKVSINSAAVREPELLTRCADRFGAQCVVASIDAKRVAGEIDAKRVPGEIDAKRVVSETDAKRLSDETPAAWRVVTHGGRTATPLDALAWAQECAQRGAGEVLLTAIDQDGKRQGYDLDLTKQVADRVPVPVVASGGAGSAQHVVDVLKQGGADAALVAGILHDQLTTVHALKDAMTRAQLPVRSAA
jgi:cyclase